MIRYILSLCTLAISFNTMAQDMDLLNDVVYENKKPIAVFTKTPYKAGNEVITGLTVYNTKRHALITVVPRRTYQTIHDTRNLYIDKKPFDYYTISFAGMNDSLHFISQEVLSLHIYNLIKKYHIIQNGGLDSSAVINLLNTYDNSLFEVQMNKIYDQMYEDKKMANQVKRDRAKPVYLVNGTGIMQDSIQVGYFGKRTSDGNHTSTSYGYNDKDPISQTKEIVGITQWESMEVINTADHTVVGWFDPLLTYKNNSRLYDLSLPLNKKLSGKNKEKLRQVCWLIENGGL